MTCASTQACAWYLDNTMVVQLGTLRSLGDLLDAPLTDGITGAVITDATVVAQLEDAAGATVSGTTWPVTLSHVSGGVYRAAVSHGVVLTEGTDYVVEIQADKSGNRATWRVPVIAQQRTG